MWEGLLEDWILHECLRAFQGACEASLTCPCCHSPHSNLKNPSHLDIYGHKIDNHDAGGLTADCPVCGKAVNVCRYAPHLEKCLGLGGRNASRPKRTAGDTPVLNNVASKTIPVPNVATEKKRPPVTAVNPKVKKIKSQPGSSLPASSPRK